MTGLRTMPHIPPDADRLDANPWADTYTATTRISELRARDHSTARDCITLEQFRALRSEGKA